MKGCKPPIKAMFFDVDGTLLSFKTHRIPQSAMDALAKAKEQGILVFVATGRHKNALRQYEQIADIGFDGYVTMNGTYCYTSRETVFDHPIPAEDIQQMVKHLRTCRTPCLFMEQTEMFVSRIDELVLAVHKEMDGYTPPVYDPIRALNRDIYQMCLYTWEDRSPPILQRLAGCTYTKWHSNGMDIHPLGVNKLVGIRKMMRHFGLLPEQVAAFGDSNNDLEMLGGVGYPVAMGNASTHLKSSALIVTDDVEHDGVAKAMQLLTGA